MRVIGIDPGTANCGFAVLEVDEHFAPAVVDAGAFRSNADNTIALRVRELSHDLAHLIREHKPACVVVETPGFGIRDVSAQAKLWAAYGAILGAADGHALVIDRTPDVWRRSLGLDTSRDLAKRAELSAKARRAEYKRQSAAYVTGRFPGVLSLLARCPGDALEHAFDAVAIACAWVASATPGVMRAAHDAHP